MRRMDVRLAIQSEVSLLEVRLAIDVSHRIAERLTWWKGIAKDDLYSIASSILDLN